MVVSSVHNPRIKDAVRLKDRRARKKSGLTLVDGTREIRRALQSGVEFKEVFVCPGHGPRRQNNELLKSLSRKRIPVVEVSGKVYEKIAFGDRKDGMVAVCRPVLPTLSALKTSGGRVFVVAEDLEKPGNLGAILRTCDAVGVDALLVADGKADIFNPNVIRSSTGAVFHVPAVPSDNPSLLAFLKSASVKIIAATPKATRVYSDCDLTGPVAVVAGSEEKGLSPFWIEHADEQVKIPMKGITDSLNVSVSVAVVLYEILRQRAGGTSRL